jgi:hypothetical protein
MHTKAKWMDEASLVIEGTHYGDGEVSGSKLIISSYLI